MVAMLAATAAPALAIGPVGRVPAGNPGPVGFNNCDFFFNNCGFNNGFFFNNCDFNNNFFFDNNCGFNDGFFFNDGINNGVFQDVD
jgi:hypothetical protein